MGTDRNSCDEQTAIWSGAAGQAWVTAQELIEQMFKPLENLLVDAVKAHSARCVLDVGCGTGGTTLAIARAVGNEGCCVGIDISEPMIAAARARAEREHTRAMFIQDDAQRRVFEPASFDAIVSRFGVMFFDDSVQAFTNFRHAARAGAQLRFIAWRSADENPFMTTAEHAAAPLLTNLPARRPDEPGQFGFAYERRVRSILEESGWTEIEFRALDIACAFPETELVGYFTRFGPVGRIFQTVEENVREQVIAIVRRAFDPYVHDGEVRFTAACWDVSARAPLQAGEGT